MDQRIYQLQVLTLGSLVVLVLLCAGLLLAVWLALNLSQLLERVRATLSRFTTETQRHGDEEQRQDSSTSQSIADGMLHHPERSGTEGYSQARQLGWEHFSSMGQAAASGRGAGGETIHTREDIPREAVSTAIRPSGPPGLCGELAIADTVEYAALFRAPLKAGDAVIVIHELGWMHGTGTVVPVGSLLTLVNAYTTNLGLRWSGHWKGHYLPSIPPESIRRATPEEAHTQAPRHEAGSTYLAVDPVQRQTFLAIHENWLDWQHELSDTDSLTSTG